LPPVSDATLTRAAIIAAEEPTASPLIVAVVATLLRDIPLGDTSLSEMVHSDVAAFLVGQFAAMPLFLRVPFRVGLSLFDFLPVLRYGRPFRWLPAGSREQFMRWCLGNRARPLRDFTKALVGLTLLAAYDHYLVHESLAQTRA
jgi:hypothetical protein